MDGLKRCSCENIWLAPPVLERRRPLPPVLRLSLQLAYHPPLLGALLVLLSLFLDRHTDVLFAPEVPPVPPVPVLRDTVTATAVSTAVTAVANAPGI